MTFSEKQKQRICCQWTLHVRNVERHCLERKKMIQIRNKSMLNESLIRGIKEGKTKTFNFSIINTYQR